jgi:hypothetical protein
MLGRGARGVYEKHFTVPLFRERLFSALDMGEVFGNAAVDSSSTSVPEGVRRRYYGAV